MTVTTHVYTATLTGTPDRLLSVRGGSLSLDAGSAPHVDGRLEIAMPDAATLAALDPRLGPRVRVQADAVTPGGTQSRTFDLGLRDRNVRHRDGTVSLQLASDEAILTDYAPLADDVTPLTFQASLRAVVGYVLGKVTPGVVLAAGADVAVPALADSQNMIRNPRVAVNITDWAATWATGGLTITRQPANGPPNIPTYAAVQATAATTGGYVYLSEGSISISAGRLYELSVHVGVNAGTLTLDAIMYDGAGNIVSFAPPVTVTPAGQWVRVSTTFYANTSNAAKLRPRVLINGTLAANAYVNVTGWRLSESTGDQVADRRYFDGDFTDTAQYDYGWTQVAHASVSTRKTLLDAATPDALTWKAGQTALEFLVPLVQRFGLRLVCDELRVWTLRAEGYTAPGALSIRHGVNLIDGSDSIGRSDGVWFDAAVTEYVWTDRTTGFQHRRVDGYALHTPYTRLQTFHKDTAYAGPGFSQYAVRRARGRGREVSATAVADWTARAEQPVTIVLEGAPAQIGQTIAVEFDLDRDEMTVRTRTTDTPAGAIDLLAGTIDALTGTIDALT